MASTAFSRISFPSSSFQLQEGEGGAFTGRRTMALTFLTGLGGGGGGRAGFQQVGRSMSLITSVAQNYSNRVTGVRRLSPSNSNSNSNSMSWHDSFAAGWNGPENAPEIIPHHRIWRQLLKEIIATGLVFVAASSIVRRSRSHSRLDVQIHPLISQPEMSEASIDQVNVIEVGNDERNISIEHSTTDPERDASSSIESYEASESNYRDKTSNVKAPDLASSEKVVTCSELSFASEDFSERRNFQDGNSLVGSSSEEKVAHNPSEKLERLSETEANRESISVDDGVENLNHASQEMIDFKKDNEASADENTGNVFTSAGIPDPTFVSAALPVVPSDIILVPAGVDEVQALALPALKVIEAAQSEDTLSHWMIPAGIVERRSRFFSTMYSENGTEVPNFSSIQGLAEPDLISSNPSIRDKQAYSDDTEMDASSSIESNKAYESNYSGIDTDNKPPSVETEADQEPFSVDGRDWKKENEAPNSSSDLSQCEQGMITPGMDIVNSRTSLLAVPKKVLVPGFVNQVQTRALAAFQALKAFGVHLSTKFRLRPAPVADLAAGVQGIVARAIEYTRQFQSDKPVTKAQPAAIALATMEASGFVGKEPARIEVESMAENAVANAAHNDCVAQVKERFNATYEKELQLEKEKVADFKKELERARHAMQGGVRREEALMNERDAVDSPMKVLRNSRGHQEDERKAFPMTRSLKIKKKRARNQAKAIDLEVTRGQDTEFMKNVFIFNFGKKGSAHSYEGFTQNV